MRKRAVYRRLLHRWPAGGSVPREKPGGENSPRSTSSWNTVDVVKAAGSEPVMSKTGHAFIKERMREEAPSTAAEMKRPPLFSVILPTATADDPVAAGRPSCCA
ncbi:hypothetical protein ACVXG7_21720 [Enterobacter hormaechei]